MKKNLISSFCVALLFSMFLYACTSHKEGNKNVKISLQITSPQMASELTNIIKDRIIGYGIPEENISFSVKDNIVDIEVKNADNGERIVYLVTTTGKLEFWETYENKDAFNFLADANKKLGELFVSTDSLFIIGDDTLNKPVAKGKTVVAAKKDSTNVSLTETVKEGKEMQKKEQKESNELYKKENPLFCFIQPNLIQKEGGKQELGYGALVGRVNINDTMKVNYLLHICFEKRFFPRDLKFLWLYKPTSKEEPVLELIAIKIRNRDETPVLDGSVITEASQEDAPGGNNEISMTMNAEGAKIWKRLTAENVDRCIAMVIDNYVYTYPKVMDQIPNGRSKITGKFTKEEAEDLATIIRCKPLPAFKVVKVSITDEPK